MLAICPGLTISWNQTVENPTSGNVAHLAGLNVPLEPPRGNPEKGECPPPPWSQKRKDVHDEHGAEEKQQKNPKQCRQRIECPGPAGPRPHRRVPPPADHHRRHS